MNNSDTDPRRNSSNRNAERHSIDGRPAPRRSTQSGNYSPSPNREVYRMGTGTQHAPRASHNLAGHDDAQREFRRRQRAEAGNANTRRAARSGQSQQQRPLRNSSYTKGERYAIGRATRTSERTTSQRQNTRAMQQQARQQYDGRPSRQQYDGRPSRQQYDARASQQATRQRQAGTGRTRGQYAAAQDDFSYQNTSPRHGTDTYVNRGYSRKRSRLPFFIGGGIAAVLVVFLIVNLVGALSAPAQSQEDEALTANDTAVTSTTLTISFAGDCTLGTDENFSADTSFNTKYSSVGDPSYFMANVASIFASDDLTVANMEGTLTTSTSRQDKTYAFKGPAEYANILVKGNIDTVSLANNHSHDYGDSSYTDTISALDAAGVESFGYDRIDYRDVKGVKVALIGTYELAKHLDIQDEMKQNIQTAKDNGAQLICVYLHWGTEKETVPDEIQVELGHMAVDAGADLVVGSHPHVIQGYEKYNGRYIVYSLGNFCFGGNPNPSDKDCMIFQQTFTVTGNDVATDDAINVIPCSISSSSSRNNYQPTPAEGDEKTRIEAKIEKSNNGIATVSKQVQQASSSSTGEGSSTNG